MDNKSVSKYVKLQKLALSIAKIPHNLKHNKYKKDEVVTLPRHEDKAKFKVYKKSSTNAILVLPRYDHDLKIAVVEIIDLKNFKILHTYKPNIKSIFLSVDYTDPQHQFNKKIYRNKPTGTRNPVIMKDGHYMPPTAPGYSITMHEASLAEYEFPGGAQWKNS